jgi:hypothetical protein
MGVNTKMFIAVNKEAIIEVMPLIINALNKWQRKKLDAYVDKKGFNNRASFLFRDKYSEVNKGLKDFTNGISGCNTSDFRNFNVNFKVLDEQRNLFITHTCSNDYCTTYDGEKIIFSLGCWGLSEEIMMVCSEAIKGLGDIYYTKNDYQEDFKKLDFSFA